MKMSLFMSILKIFISNCFSNEKVLQEHKETCLKITFKQTVKLGKASIKLKNHFKQLAVPFKIYADSESVLKSVKSNDKNTIHRLKNLKDTFLTISLTKLFVLMISLAKRLFY